MYRNCVIVINLVISSLSYFHTYTVIIALQLHT